MEELSNRKVYGPEMALKIETMGSITVSIANRWELGWPERVKELMKSGTYLSSLQAQVELEKDVLAEAGHLQHLSHSEILKLHEIQESPPAA